MRFHLDELLDKQVIIELEDGESLRGTFVGDCGDFLVLRGQDGTPYLFNERYVRSLYLMTDAQLPAVEGE